MQHKKCILQALARPVPKFWHDLNRLFRTATQCSDEEFAHQVQHCQNRLAWHYARCVHSFRCPLPAASTIVSFILTADFTADEICVPQLRLHRHIVPSWGAGGQHSSIWHATPYRISGFSQLSSFFATCQIMDVYIRRTIIFPNKANHLKMCQP